MTSQNRRTAYSFFLGALMASFILISCNNKKDKKDDTPKTDTTKVEPMPPTTPDTAGMDKDTGDVRGVDPVKPGEGSVPPSGGK